MPLGRSLCRPERGDGLLDYTNCTIDLGIGIEMREAKPDGLPGSLVGAGHRHYYMRWTKGVRAAR